MPKFVFKLQALLDHRVRIERDRQLALASVEQERRRLEGEVAARQRELAALKADLRGALGERPGARVDLGAVRLQTGAMLRDRARAQQLVLQLAGVHRRIEAARQALREASTARRAVELLRDRQELRWRQEQNRRESAALDELAVMRAGREATAAGPPRAECSS